MNRLPIAKRAQILSLLCEGSSMRTVSRVVDVSINSVSRELVVAGQACADFHDRTVRNVASKRVQCDEVWSFVGMKEKTAKHMGSDRRPNTGDVWTWTGIDADSKLIVAWLLGGRDAGAAHEFMTDLASRLARRVQLTTDGHAAYLSAVPGAFGLDVDYAQLVKIYGADTSEEHRYSPAICIGAEPHRVIGFPEREHISTSYIERSNLTLRMHNRRFTRLTNAFSKKLENHAHMVALYTVWYNFVKLHKTLRCTPAMEAKIETTDATKDLRLTNRLWTVEDLVEIADEWEAKQPHQKVGRKLGQVARKSN